MIIIANELGVKCGVDLSQLVFSVERSSRSSELIFSFCAGSVDRVEYIIQRESQHLTKKTLATRVEGQALVKAPVKATKAHKTKIGKGKARVHLA